MFTIKRADPTFVTVGDFDETILTDQNTFCAFILVHVRAARAAGVPLRNHVRISHNLAVHIMPNFEAPPWELASRSVLVNNEYMHDAMMVMCDFALPPNTVEID